MENRKQVKVKNPIVEIGGDEMARVMWEMVKQRLILPYFDVDLIYFDLGIKKRDKTDDQITREAAKAIVHYGVSVKCATITPDEKRVQEYHLKKAWPSPNGTIRNFLDGTIFRKPILVENIKPVVVPWVRSIIIGRHGYGDLYKDAEMLVSKPGKVELVYTPLDGSPPTTLLVKDFESQGVVLAMHNLEKSIRNFAKSSIQYALSEKMDIWFGAKDTISKTYHAFFKRVFQEEVDYCQTELAEKGIGYSYYLIDDAAARLIRHPGNVLLACMNYEGDLLSDIVAAGFGSLGMLTSVLVSPAGQYEFEAAHGTVQKHYYKHLKGESTSTNPTAIIFAWTGALAKRGELDNTPEVVEFAKEIEAATIGVIEDGVLTGDLARLIQSPADKVATTEEFIDAIVEKVEQLL